MGLLINNTHVFVLALFFSLGDIPDLFSDEEVDMIVTSMRMELRGLGLIDTRDSCWSFFIERIRRQLKVLNISYRIV